jgi:hydrogenase expression/formation protein HypD
MKYLDEYRDAAGARKLAAAIHRTTTRPWSIMEVCGGQTHSIVRFGVDTLLPEAITLIHGPGCPVCVTPIEIIDQAIALAGRPEVTLCSFGDMLRVPGSEKDLLQVKSEGGDVRVVYSPLDALTLAAENPDREVVFFAVGFETTAPANAMSVFQAARQGISNFSLLVSHVLVPPAIDAILGAPDSRVDGFLAAGHVCAVMGTEAYERLVRAHRVPMVVTGFEPLDLLHGILLCVQQLESGEARVENPYARAVRPAGNPEAVEMIREVFKVTDRQWRGIGTIPGSGLTLRGPYVAHDAEQRFALEATAGRESSECLSGLILQGRKKPPDCPAFGTRCTPEKPLGATMVSGEGACAVYYRFGRRDEG